MPEWRSRTYSYTEPADDCDTGSYGGANAGPDGITYPGNRSDYDAGYEAGRLAGWIAGYEHVRRLNEHDLAAERDGRKPVLSAIMQP